LLQLASLETKASPALLAAHPLPHPTHPPTAAHDDAQHDRTAHGDTHGDRGDTVVGDHHLANGLVYADHRTNLPPGWYVPVAYTH
jgi:hypothetical protein